MAKRVLVFGTFDLLHPGHMDFLHQARELGDELHVVIARDQTVKTVKGRSAVQEENTRRLQVQEQPMVTKAYLGNLDDKYRIVTELKPDVIALGYDQNSFTDALPDELKKRGLAPQILRLQPYRPEHYKTSKIRQSEVDKANQLVL